MKLCSVTFFPENTSVGGAQTPAIAFKEWCEELGIECEVVGVTHKRTEIFTNPLLDLVLHCDDLDTLNHYDGIFFQTPPYPKYINLDCIKTNFVGMIHGEGDMQIYGTVETVEFFRHDHCVGMAHIDPEDKFFSYLHDNRMFWHPCVRPKFSTFEDLGEDRKFQMMFASRVARRKNPILFNKVANEMMYLTGGAQLNGVSHDRMFDNAVDACLGGVERSGFTFSTDEVFLPRKFGFFWEVIGTPDIELQMNRLSLCGIEALSSGLMPIVNKNAVQGEFKGLFIEIDPFDLDMDKLRKDMIHFMRNRRTIMPRVMKKLRNSKAGYNYVCSSVQSIITSITGE